MMTLEIALPKLKACQKPAYFIHLRFKQAFDTIGIYCNISLSWKDYYFYPWLERAFI